MKRLISGVVGVFLVGGATSLAACSSTNLGTPVGSDGGGVGGDGGTNHLLNPPEHHITAGAACRSTRPAGINTGDGGACDPDAGAFCRCESDAECTGGTNGRCISNSNGGPHCTYDSCSTSTDCATGSSCACGDVAPTSFNLCVPSNCRTDGDCGSGGFCSPSLGSCGTYGGEYAGVYCHTASDECNNDSDCKSDSGQSGFCSYVTEAGKWACSYSICAG